MLPFGMQRSLPFPHLIRPLPTASGVPSYFFHVLLPAHTASLLWAFITESSLPGDLGTCQKHQLSSNHQAEEREGDGDRSSLTHCLLTAVPSTLAPPCLASWPHHPSPTPVSRLLLHSPRIHLHYIIPTQLPAPGIKPRVGAKSTRQKETSGPKPEGRELMTCQGTWGLVSFLPLTSCVTLDKPPSLSEPPLLTSDVEANNPRTPP